MTRVTRGVAAALALLLTTTATLAACGGAPAPEGPVVVDHDTDRPFVLRGVSNLTEIAQLTGPGAINDTESVAVAGTDLGSMVTVGDRTYLLFGDTFGVRDPDSYGGQGEFWRSNVVAWTTDDDPSDGLTFDGWLVDDVGLAAPIVEGDHDPGGIGAEVTKIPTYGFAVEDAIYVLFMSVESWNEPGAWDANYAALARSTDDGATWETLDAPRWPGDSGVIQVATAHVVEDGEEYVYFWTIPAGRFGGVSLMRVPATRAAVEDEAAYSYFVGTDDDGSPRWSSDLTDAVRVVDPTVGELSVMWSTYLERWVMTYSDLGNAYIREGLTPWGPWGEPIELVSGADYPGLYSPYLSPRYTSADGRTLYFTLSLWGPYNVFWFSVDLDRL